MSSEILKIENDHGIIKLLLNRPAAKNSLNGELLGELERQLEYWEKDQYVKAVCLVSSVDGVFCAGADLAGVTNLDQALEDQQKYAEILKLLDGYKKMTIALVNGHCLGGGLGLALSCDIVLSDEKGSFGTPEIKVGLYPLMISTLIYRCMGEKKANAMIAQGKILSARQAWEWGLVSELLPINEWESWLKALSEKNHTILEFGKSRVRHSLKARTFDEATDYLCESLGELVQTPEAQAAIMSFMKKA